MGDKIFHLRLAGQLNDRLVICILRHRLPRRRCRKPLRDFAQSVQKDVHFGCGHNIGFSSDIESPFI